MISSDEYTFEQWLSDIKYTRYPASTLMTALKVADAFLCGKKLSKVSIFSITDPSRFSWMIDQMLGLRFYRLLHSKTANQIECAAKLYKEFLVYKSLMNSTVRTKQIRSTVNSRAKDVQPESTKSFRTIDLQPKSSEHPIEIIKQSVSAERLNPINTTPEIDTQQPRPSIQRALPQKGLADLLKDRYPYGFKYDSLRELLRLRRFAEVEQIDLPDDDDELRNRVLSFGELVEDRVYFRDDALANGLKELVDYASCSGTKVIYYERLFAINNDWLNKHYVTSAEILIDLLKKSVKGWSFAKQFMVFGNKKSEKQAVTDEIIRVWGSQQLAVVSDLDERLPYIPDMNIWRVICGNPRFVRVSDGKYLFVDRLIITESEADDILEFVEEECNKNGFVSLNDVPRDTLEEQNYELTPNAIMGAIYNKVLMYRYNLNGKIITKDQKDIDAVSLLKQHIRDKDTCTFEEVSNKVLELTGGMNRPYAFQALYDCLVRIDVSNYVSDKYVSFDVGEIDKLLSGIIKGRFCVLRDIISFSMFPICGYPWNLFLLESYCYRFSNKYDLRVKNFNDKNVGIIAEKTYDKSYDEMLSIVLAKSSIELTTEKAGQHLWMRGYLARSKYTNMDMIVERAKKLREEQ